MEELGWEPEPEEAPPRSLRRALVVSVLGDMGRDPEVLRQAERLAALEAQDPERIDASLAPVVVALAAQRGTAARPTQFVAIYQERKKAGAAPGLQSRYLSTLVAFEDPAV
jgi:hypothetical protein